MVHGSTISFGFAALFLAACAGTVSDEAAAQPPAMGQPPQAAPGGAERGEGFERRLARMQAELELTDEQVALIRPIFERRRAEREALRDLAPEERHARRESLRAGIRAELEDVLTPDQLTKLDEMHARHGRHGRHGGRGRGMGRRGPPDPERMLSRMQEHLELTDDQVTRVRPILERTRDRLVALRDVPREDRREAARTIRDETKTELAQVLTPEQLAKLEEHFARRRGRHGRGARH